MSHQKQSKSTKLPPPPTTPKPTCMKKPDTNTAATKQIPPSAPSSPPPAADLLTSFTTPTAKKKAAAAKRSAKIRRLSRIRNSQLRQETDLAATAKDDSAPAKEERAPVKEIPVPTEEVTAIEEAPVPMQAKPAPMVVAIVSPPSAKKESRMEKVHRLSTHHAKLSEQEKETLSFTSSTVPVPVEEMPVPVEEMPVPVEAKPAPMEVAIVSPPNAKKESRDAVPVEEMPVPMEAKPAHMEVAIVSPPSAKKESRMEKVHPLSSTSFTSSTSSISSSQIHHHRIHRRVSQFKFAQSGVLLLMKKAYSCLNHNGEGHEQLRQLLESLNVKSLPNPIRMEDPFVVRSLSQFFTEADVNKDGFISPTEFANAMSVIGDKLGDKFRCENSMSLFSSMDIDGDSRIELSELLKGVEAVNGTKFLLACSAVDAVQKFFGEQSSNRDRRNKDRNKDRNNKDGDKDREKDGDKNFMKEFASAMEKSSATVAPVALVEIDPSSPKNSLDGNKDGDTNIKKEFASAMEKGPATVATVAPVEIDPSSPKNSLNSPSWILATSWSSILSLLLWTWIPLFSGVHFATSSSWQHAVVLCSILTLVVWVFSPPDRSLPDNHFAASHIEDWLSLEARSARCGDIFGSSRVVALAEYLMMKRSSLSQSDISKGAAAAQTQPQSATKYLQQIVRTGLFLWLCLGLVWVCAVDKTTFVTASDIVARHSIAKRVFLITGGTSGIGLETARSLMAGGAHVIIASRSQQREEHAINDLHSNIISGQSHHEFIDLSNFSTIDSFVKRLKGSHTRLDGVVLNAGLITPFWETTTDGIEKTVQVNHLSQLYLVQQLIKHKLLSRHLDRSAKDYQLSQVVFVSEELPVKYSQEPSSLQFEFSDFPFFIPGAYGASKQASIRTGRELQRRHATDIEVFSVYPGHCSTQLGVRRDGFVLEAYGAHIFWWFASYFVRVKTLGEAASTSIQCLLERTIEHGFYKDNRRTPWPKVEDNVYDDRSSKARNQKDLECWEKSIQLIEEGRQGVWRNRRSIEIIEAEIGLY